MLYMLHLSWTPCICAGDSRLLRVHVGHRREDAGDQRVHPLDRWELDFYLNAGVWYKSQQVCELGTSCTWCTKLSPGPLFLVHCWRIAIYGKIFFRLISYPVIVRRRHKIPSPGIYLTFVMAMTTVSVIMTVMVLNFFYRGPVLTEVPPWVRKWEYSHLNVVAYLALILKEKMAFVRSYIWHLIIVYLCLWLTD